MKIRTGFRPSPALLVIQAVVGIGIAAFSLHLFVKNQQPTLLFGCLVAAGITIYYGIKVIRGISAVGGERTTSLDSSPHTIPLGDPVVAKTGWEPAAGGGQSFRGHRLVQVDYNRLEFRGTLGGIFFSLVFLIPGLLLAATAIYDATVAPVPGVKSTIGSFIFGIVFAAVGILLFPLAIVFDRRANLFWKGRLLPWRRGEAGSKSANIPLENIYAIQILSELIKGKSTYYSYELNLVLKDGSRVNVVDQGGLEKLRKEADTISRFLGRPVWEK